MKNKSIFIVSLLMLAACAGGGKAGQDGKAESADNAAENCAAENCASKNCTEKNCASQNDTPAKSSSQIDWETDTTMVDGRMVVMDRGFDGWAFVVGENPLERIPNMNDGKYDDMYLGIRSDVFKSWNEEIGYVLDGPDVRMLAINFCQKYKRTQLDKIHAIQDSILEYVGMARAVEMVEANDLFNDSPHYYKAAQIIAQLHVEKSGEIVGVRFNIIREPAFSKADSLRLAKNQNQITPQDILAFTRIIRSFRLDPIDNDTIEAILPNANFFPAVTLADPEDRYWY